MIIGTIVDGIVIDHYPRRPGHGPVQGPGAGQAGVRGGRHQERLQRQVRQEGHSEDQRGHRPQLRDAGVHRPPHHREHHPGGRADGEDPPPPAPRPSPGSSGARTPGASPPSSRSCPTSSASPTGSAGCTGVSIATQREGSGKPPCGKAIKRAPLSTGFPAGDRGAFSPASIRRQESAAPF
mgnify:CR=1 FL=1